jgi:hypothetical protein
MWMAGGLDRHNFPEGVASEAAGGHNFREFVTILGYSPDGPVTGGVGCGGRCWQSHQLPPRHFSCR